MNIKETEGIKVYGFQWIGNKNEEYSDFEYVDFNTPWNEVIEYLKWFEGYYGVTFINKYWVYDEEGNEIDVKYR